MEDICIITKSYPTKKDPTTFTFVDQLACAMSDLGINITVINPIPIFSELLDQKRFYKNKWQRITPSVTFLLST